MSDIIFGTITSQGQLTIPAKVRRLLGLKTSSGVILKVKNNSLVIEPEKELLSLGGKLGKYAKKGKSIDQIREIEKNAARQAIAQDYQKKFQKDE